MSPYPVTINCRCCGLVQTVRDRDGALPTICDICHRHQGKLPDKRLARAEAHEEMLRERLTACRRSERQAQYVMKAAKEQVRAALASRGWLAERILRASGMAGHRCPASDLGRDRQVVKFAEQNEWSEWRGY
jgi:hypothetical protein